MQQPGYNFNGHGYPYNHPQGSNQNQPQPPNSYPRVADTSSEEENTSGSGLTQGHAWVEQPSSGLQPPLPGSQYGRPSIPSSDRRNHSRADKGSDYGRWNSPETIQPVSNSFQPSTWRGLGPGFEQRPSYPARRPTTEGTFFKIYFCLLSYLRDYFSYIF